MRGEVHPGPGGRQLSVKLYQCSDLDLVIAIPQCLRDDVPIIQVWGYGPQRGAGRAWASASTTLSL